MDRHDHEIHPIPKALSAFVFISRIYFMSDDNRYYSRVSKQFRAYAFYFLCYFYFVKTLGRMSDHSECYFNVQSGELAKLL